MGLPSDRLRDGMVRVLVVVDSLDQGGAEQSMMAVLPLMRDLGIDPELALLRSSSPDRERSMVDAGVPVKILGPARGPLGVARALRPLLRRDPPDVAHLNLFAPIVGGALAALGTRVPLLASQVNTPPDRRRSAVSDTAGARWKVRLAVGVEAFACRHAVAHLHAVTPGVRDAVASRYRVLPGRITVAERGRDATRFRPATPADRSAARRRWGLADDDEVLVALGRHEPSKGFDDLIDAMAPMAQERPRLRLLLAGREGTATDDLRRRIARTGLVDRVRLLGDVTDPESVLAAADVFVLSSRREGTSGATIEAMASGLPVVATELTGLRGIVIDDQQALTVPVADPPAMAAAIKRVLDDPVLARRLAATGRTMFLARFTLDQAAASLALLYRQVAVAGR